MSLGILQRSTILTNFRHSMTLSIPQEKHHIRVVPQAVQWQPRQVWMSSDEPGML